MWKVLSKSGSVGEGMEVERVVAATNFPDQSWFKDGGVRTAGQDLVVGFPGKLIHQILASSVAITLAGRRAGEVDLNLYFSALGVLGNCYQGAEGDTPMGSGRSPGGSRLLGLYGACSEPSLKGLFQNQPSQSPLKEHIPHHAHLL